MSASAGGVRQPRKLSEVTEPPQRVRSVVVVTAFGLIGQGRPVSRWLVSSLCPFGCQEQTHTFTCRVGYLPGAIAQRFEYCTIADSFYSVIVPESLRRAAFDEVES